MRVIHALREFIALESAGGILLAIAAAAALTLANSPLAFLYDAFLDTPVEVRVGALQIAKPLLLWVNGGGATHTFEEYRAWLEEVGLTQVRQLSERWAAAVKSE